MTWAPCQRIVRADVPPSFRVRGISAPLLLCWPNAALGSGADYSVDFGPMLCCDDRIVRVGASTTGGTIAWTSVFGTLATLWVQWTTSGPQTVQFSALTANGAPLDVTVSIMVGAASLLTAPVPDDAPNAFLLGTAFLPDAAGNSLILG